MRELVDRISFPTEYNDITELRISIALLFITCIVYFTVSSLALTINWFLFSKTLLTGTIAYEFILLYLLDKYAKELINNKVKGKHVKRTLNVTSSGVFALLITLTFLALIYTMTLPTPVMENKFLSLLLSLILIVLPTIFWDELVHYFKKKGFKRLGLTGLLLLLIITPGFSVNQSLNQTISSLSTIEKALTYISTMRGVASNFESSLQDFGLTEQQSRMVMLIGILISVFLLLKFLSVIVKWVIIILIVWIIIQMLL